jgi:hypothetical protein
MSARGGKADLEQGPELRRFPFRQNEISIPDQYGSKVGFVGMDLETITFSADS